MIVKSKESFFAHEKWEIMIVRYLNFKVEHISRNMILYVWKPYREIKYFRHSNIPHGLQSQLLILTATTLTTFRAKIFKTFLYTWNNNLHDTSGFATTHVVVSLRQPITYWSPQPLSPTKLPNTLKFIRERIKLTARVEFGASIHAIFQLTVRRIQMFFSLKPSQSQGESYLKISARWGSLFRRS